jgi:cytochrome P450
MARLEATAAIGALAARAPKGWTVDDEVLTYGPSFFLRGLTRLRITLT